MKFNLFRFSYAALPLSLVCLAVFAGTSQAQAESPSSDDAPLAESSVSAPSQPAVVQTTRVVKPTPGKVAQSAIGLSSLRSPGAETSAQVNSTQSSISPRTVMAQSTSPSGTSQPDLKGTPTQTQTTPQPVQTPIQTQSAPTTPAQSMPQIQPTVPTETTPTTPTTPTETTPTSPTPILNQVSPGRATRSGSSYVGVGGNIGLGSGDTSLGQGSFAVISKVGLLPSFSVRPSVLFSDNVTILLPITYDFSVGAGPTGALGFNAAPYVGLGAAISTGDGADVALLLTGGIDVPISSQFTATAAVNATVTGEAAVGILIGVGYNFNGF